MKFLCQLLVAILVALLISAPAFSAITLDATTQSNSDAPSDPTNFSHTIASGATLLVVLVVHREFSALVGVTWNTTESLILARADGPATAANTSVWYLINPTSGTHTVSVDFTGAPNAAAILAVSLFGTATVSPIDASNGASDAGGANLSVDLTSVTNGAWMLDVVCGRSGGSGVTITQGAESGRTDWSADWEYEPGGNEIGAGGTKYENVSPAGQKTFSWTFTNATGSSLTAVAIKPAVTEFFRRRIFH